MPKIIENARGIFIDEAKKQIAANGYENVTIRSISKGCSLGLGTFYNYFKSKDMLIATFLLEDWKERIGRVAKECCDACEPMAVVELICGELDAFMKNNNAIFTSPQAIKAFNNTVGSYHRVLRGQIAEPIYKACLNGGYENAGFLSEFVAEAALTWTVAKKSFDELSPIFKKLFVK